MLPIHNDDIRHAIAHGILSHLQQLSLPYTYQYDASRQHLTLLKDGRRHYNLDLVNDNLQLQTCLSFNHCLTFMTLDYADPELLNRIVYFITNGPREAANLTAWAKAHKIKPHHLAHYARQPKQLPQA